MEPYELLEYDTECDRFLDKVYTVYIAVPHHLHEELARKALMKGKHVLCEKPLTLSRDTVEDLFRFADGKGCILQEAADGRGCVYPRRISLFPCGDRRYGGNRRQTGGGFVHHRNAGVHLCACSVVEDRTV